MECSSSVVVLNFVLRNVDHRPGVIDFAYLVGSFLRKLHGTFHTLIVGLNQHIGQLLETALTNGYRDGS